ncbi:hypothetical protein HZS_6535 [Henneguya salminicola]|nr:hypothetical protein HZS_6535 [Henneguya salminicola]
MDLTTWFLFSKKFTEKSNYICSIRDMTRCPAKLIVSGDIITMKGFPPICYEKKILTNQIQRSVLEGFAEKYIDGKSLCLELYPGQIYEKLLCQLRELFSDISYQNRQKVGRCENTRKHRRV